MPIAQVDVTNHNTMAGLYTTPGLVYAANSLLNDELTGAVTMMHLGQPRSKDYAAYGVLISDLYNTYRLERRSLLLETLLCCSALCKTYAQIEGAFVTVARVAVAIHQKTVNIADDWLFPRIIPDDLDAMRLPSLEAITQDDMHRIWCAHPFVDYMELLRAERQRLMLGVMDGKIADMLALVRLKLDQSAPRTSKTTLRRLQRKYHTARRSVRRSVDMYNRLGKRDLLNRFLRSSNLEPLIIPGHRYDYHLLMKPNLLRETAHCDEGVASVLSVVCEKNTYNRLGEICVYFPETPPLDHVLATELYLHNPERELDFLRSACFMDANTAFFHDPILPELKGIARPTEMPIMTLHTHYHAWSDPDYRRLRNTKAHLPDLVLLANQSFQQIMHVGQRYLPLLADVGHRLEIEDYLLGTPEATSMTKTVRDAMENREF